MYWFSNITYELLQKQAISYLFSYNHNFFGRNIQEREQKSPVKVACTVQRPRKKSSNHEGTFRRSLPENNRSNQSNQSNGSKLSRGANENPKEIQPHSLKRGKTRPTKSRLVLVWKLSGRENGASFLDQLHSEVKQTQRNPWLLSIIYQSINLRDKGKTKDSRKSGPYVKLFRFFYN